VKSSHFRIYALVSFMTVIWGVNYVVAKLALKYFPPLVFAPLRTIFATALLIPIYWWSHRHAEAAQDPPWTRREWLQLAVLGVAGITLNQVFFIVGMGKTSVAHAALIIATGPVVVLLMAAMRGLERINARKVAGLGFAILGIAVLQWAPGKADRGASLAGDALIFLAAFFFALFTIGGKEMTRRHGPIVVNTVGFACGTVASLPVLIWASRGFDWSSPGFWGWSTVLYMAAFPSVLCYLIFYHALEHLPATRVSVFSYAQPLIAAISGWLILGEPVTAGVAGATALVLGGVWLASRAQ
jgi:drug/metabolite transporter (DMT)-like permease